MSGKLINQYIFLWILSFVFWYSSFSQEENVEEDADSTSSHIIIFIVIIIDLHQSHRQQTEGTYIHMATTKYKHLGEGERRKQNIEKIKRRMW